MKYWKTLALVLALAAPVTAGAVSSQDLANTERFRPVYMSETGVVYADMTSIRAAEAVEGQFPMLQLDLYLESYREAPTYDLLSGGQLVDVIYAYHSKLLAARRMSEPNGPLQFYGDNRIFGIFMPDGSPANRSPQTGEAKAIDVAQEAQDIYLNLSRWL